jgi:eukaryotic-like serine/threonine-protein kinase
MTAVSAAERLRDALADRYRVERELGAGGMATVYLAEDLKHRRRVAIKVLRPELTRSLGAHRFLREIETTANLRHPHILPLYDSGHVSMTGSTEGQADANADVLYYVMPFVEGETLRDRLARERQLPIDDALRIAREVSDALSYAHARGIVHRDIKPENILLESGHAVVADFGIARAVSAAGAESLTGTGITVGTPAYMSPEQAAGDHDLDGRSDLYALGCVLYEMLAGQPPFTGPTVESIARQHLIAEPQPVTNLRPAVPGAVLTALHRALAKNPADRFNPVAQFADALRAGASAAPSETAPAPPASSPPRSLPRFLRRLEVIGVAVAIVAAVTFALWRRGAPASSPSAPPKSIAVLPFESVGGDTANVYFAEGIADELTTALTAVDGLRVAATSSAFTYRGKTVDAREVGKALNVGTVLQGRVRRAGSALRVSAQLTNAADGLVVWSRSYERDAKDVFAVQDELAREIAGALRITLAGGAAASGTQGTRDVAAHDLYLRGLYFLNQRGPGVARSISYFRQAIERDSTFARAWAQLGTAHGLVRIFELVAPDTTFREARAAINHALRLDSLGAEAHAASGLILAMDGRWKDAWAEYQRAIELDPNYAISYRLALSTLAVLGQEADAVSATRALVERDPLSPVTFAVVAMTQLSFGRRNEALGTAKRALELDAAGAMPRAMLASALLAAGERDSARALAAIAGRTPNTTPWIAWVLATTGDREGAAALVREVEGQRGRQASANVTIAFAALGVGDTTRALDALEQATKAREAVGFMAPFGLPAYDPIRGSARFAAVIRAFGADPAPFIRPAGVR